MMSLPWLTSETPNKLFEEMELSCRRVTHSQKVYRSNMKSFVYKIGCPEAYEDV